MPRPVRIAICQFASELPTTGSVSNNFAKLTAFVSSAADQRADLIVFPEYFLTGRYPHKL
jgi:predicted amidohydrolase